MDELFAALLEDESGQDLAEYGLLLALIAVVVASAIVAFRGTIVNAFNDATDAMQK